MELNLHRFRPGILILVGVLIAGTIGYYLIEAWSPLQAFYSTILVISTLGLTRAPDSPAGMALTIGLIISGVGTLFYLLSQVAETVIESSLASQKERRVSRQIAAMSGHSIICGYGRVGVHAAQELAHEQRDFVVVDSDPEALEGARANDYIVLQGNATEDHVLKAAGVERAACLLITTSSDAANVFITLSARSFNPRLVIVARASADSSEAKLKKAGADHVIAPETIGGKRMASLATRPEAADVVEDLISSQNNEGWLEQTTVEPGSSLVGLRICDANIYTQTGATIIAIRRRDGNNILNPSGDEYIREGDVLVSVGAREELDRLERMTGAQEGEAG